MPAARPRASFEPIPPDFDIRTFVETSDNFQYVDRISFEMLAHKTAEEFEKLVLLHVIIAGRPLIIDGFDEVLDPWTFTPSWVSDNHGDKVENARNLTVKDNIPLTIKHYLKHLGRLTEQFFDGSENYKDKNRQRIYLKDIDCPPVWQEKLSEHIPASLFYLNECTGDIGGPGATDKNGFRKGRGIARAGDLMSSLPPEMRAENLMCYIGHEGTYTPSHREMCASLGQNIMVNASGHISEDGQPERPGSSIWFMTETHEREVVAEYWLSVLGHDIEVEDHFAQLMAWKKAPFKTYVAEQRPGDFILIPPLAPHQVWNRGTRTMKIAWNRTTVDTLELAMAEALPNSRLVCRDEQYKNKSIVYYTLLKYSTLLKSARRQIELGGEQAEAIQRSLKIRQVQHDFKRLFDLFKTILLSEMFTPDSREHPDFEAYDSNVTCSYCRCNIFNRFMTCKSCNNAFSSEVDEPYDVCMDCYCMGRSCACQSGHTWVEQWKWKDLTHKYEEWRAQVIDIDGHKTEKTPLPLQEERRYLGKKTLAQVCQEQLKLRPTVDINNPQPAEETEDEEIQVNDDGTVKRMVKKRSKQWLHNHKSCHSCLKRHPKWKMAFCSNCDLAYCYGTLFRAHDTMPLVMMENPNWKCPHCTRTCNTGACRRDPRQHPYQPKGTLLGHDTKKVADPRSIECLVDFSISNLSWLREDDLNGQGTGPLQRRRDQAERAKLDDPTLDERYIDEDHEHTIRNGIAYSPVEDSHTGFNNLGPPITRHNGFVDPSAVEYERDVAMQDNGGDPYPPDPDLNGGIPRLGKRGREDDEDLRKGPNKKAKKRNKKNEPRSETPITKNTSGKQYQKEVEKKLLEDAKKDGRYVLVAARIKNKSRVVKLSLDSGLLEALQNRPMPERLQRVQDDEPEEPTINNRSILESDIGPKPNVSTHPGEVPKLPSSFRFRVEEDDLYTTRKRDREAHSLSKVGRPNKSSRRYEEVTLDSDKETDDEDLAETSGRSISRASRWLARKNEGDDDLPQELPPGFRDGFVNPNRARDRERRKTMPAKPKAQIRSPGGRRRPPRKSTGNMSDADADHEDDQGDSTIVLAQPAAAALEAQKKAEEEKARAEAVAREAEENLRAKMAIAGWDEQSDGADDNLNTFIDTLAAEDDAETQDTRNESPPVVTRGDASPQSSTSIFSRPGMTGKKIKIVSAKNANRTTTTTQIPVKAAAPNFKKSTKVQEVNLSESELGSEDEIPAKTPATKLPLKRRVGRHSLNDVRGNVAKPTRGRGRPRKTM
ncbi:hypothetical protein EJ04DRAFT_574703 [Polyplosphaeria fusca]|uniref:JmjC domain-containing protein n=1 Tax=Polyplosphaeria fusca TaxID=682080 RepID=A0A9P4R388_9PLEO|nr:hypothetical protein EJ04DRAFT_574703 [Polyplosphaeria fusca]